MLAQTLIWSHQRMISVSCQFFVWCHSCSSHEASNKITQVWWWPGMKNQVWKWQFQPTMVSKQLPAMASNSDLSVFAAFVINGAQQNHKFASKKWNNQPQSKIVAPPMVALPSKFAKCGLINHKKSLNQPQKVAQALLQWQRPGLIGQITPSNLQLNSQ